MENLEPNIPEEVTPQEEIPQEVISGPAAPAAEPVTAAEEIPEPRIVEEIPPQEPVSAAPKSSPFADSPYEINPEFLQQVKAKKVKKTPKRRGKFWRGALCGVLILALIAGACTATGMIVSGYWENRFDALENDFRQELTDLEKKIGQGTGISVSGSPNAVSGGLTPSQVYAQNVGSVVMIYNKVNNGIQTMTSTGSGFILTQDGYVVTNHHVVEGGGVLSVVTSDNQRYAATLVGSDQTNDLAVLKVEAQGLQAATLGSSSDLIVGDQVVAIGNPLGELTSTLTVGYVSAKERDVTTDGFAINMIQTDASINSGNSGGPLFNMKGEVVGITTAKYSGTSASGATIEGIGFAIPIDDVKGMISDLTTYGYISGAYLGVSVSDMNASAADYYGLPMGAYVQESVEGGAAYRAGVREKDIIVDLGGIPVGNVSALTRALWKFKAGDETTITVYRGGREMVLDIVLDEKPEVMPEP